MDESNQQQESSIPDKKIEFKKPVLFGRVGKLPKKVKSESDTAPEPPKEESSEEKGNEKSKPKSSLPPAVLIKELSTPIPYKEPKWSGLCPDGSDYALEVLKSGMIVEKIELNPKACHVFGRLANCDVILAHPTVSRHHAVLQYKAFAEDNEPACGWYLYDLASTHGTFLNKDRLKPNHYTRVRVGHQIKFGTSTRTYIVLGPDFDCEGESDLTVTEIKQKALELRSERDRMIQESIEQRERDRLEEERRRDEQGIDWGMGEDAEDEPDLAENPFASTANEELYLEDPKKTLRGYFEREGHELTYNCEERGAGQFICRVELPIDDARGRPMVAEVTHRGKKKEAVALCAMEACLMLDRCGLLRQATHESRRRKERDWSAEDFYDSDEDPFLDRTGVLERKRRARRDRMERRDRTEGAAAGAEPLTYDILLKQISEIEGKISAEEKTLESLRASKTEQCASERDALDEYMTSLGRHGLTMATKAEISKTKMSIHKLKQELLKTQRLAEIARPAELPPLVKRDIVPTVPKAAAPVRTHNSVVIGKRIKLKNDFKKKIKVKPETKHSETEFVEEMDSDDDDELKDDNSNTNTSSTVQTDDNLHSHTETNPTTHKDPTEHMKEKDTNTGDSETERDEHTNSTTIKSSFTNESEQDANSKHNEKERDKPKRMFGPMRPPENYVIPDHYFEQTNDRDLPEIEDN